MEASRLVGIGVRLRNSGGQIALFKVDDGPGP
ncbi:MAG: hypothetical protein DF168_02213 [Candidatus Moanabacter tarae]|uniref:Uncharacterized protein n=1 Tax=Candidatus Moanibacter tarae TaxID=2200854 RepID=A0A2Z4AIB6_9BACT|nr:MAG: hypothetical protein DF168_02213 [Candidatus Moanabacter tarae]